MNIPPPPPPPPQPKQVFVSTSTKPDQTIQPISSTNILANQEQNTNVTFINSVRSVNRLPPLVPQNNSQTENTNSNNSSMNLLGKRALPPPPPQTFKNNTYPLIPATTMPFNATTLSNSAQQLNGSKTKLSLNSLEFKVANAPKKIRNKPTFILGDVNKKNLMEDYLEQTSLFNNFFPFYKRKLDSNMAKETRMRIHDMKMNPQNYFNFGFNIEDYTQYVKKHYLMRLEREIILKEISKIKGQVVGNQFTGAMN